ncbi:hypothetical protein D1007_50276 [Hordeum vulgare]|nr:hypothetical protein D1007_50276 [Hordeum vulgare]
MVVALTPGSAMFQTRGWKSFARSRGLGPRHLLQCRFNGSATLTMKFFGASRVFLECYADSSSYRGLDFSSDSDDDTTFFDIKQEYSA